MRQKIIYLFLFTFCCLVFLEGEAVNPFVSRLPERKVVIKKEEEVEIKRLNTEGIILKGILWSPKSACAIINGKVYKKGDVLEKWEAKIINIDKYGIELKYGRNVYRIEMKRMEGKEKR
ncbi:MAG: hypothetical protein B6D56_06510 [Candidatus Omnitrophica bacterium 4484_70.1]|nr:MAG: hypothetical protein B6D56_06510 [Candidatus Omnitrophica bacterium 4484_70.1]